MTSAPPEAGTTSVALVPTPDGLAAGVPYAYGAVAPAGSRPVFLAGACPLDAAGRTVAVGDVPGQAAACLRTALLALEAAGAGVDDVLFMRVVVASVERSDLATAWDVARRGLGRDVPGTVMGATVLGWPDQLVEVELVAAVAGC